MCVCVGEYMGLDQQDFRDEMGSKDSVGKWGYNMS